MLQVFALFSFFMINDDGSSVEGTAGDANQSEIPVPGVIPTSIIAATTTATSTSTAATTSTTATTSTAVATSTAITTSTASTTSTATINSSSRMRTIIEPIPSTSSGITTRQGLQRARQPSNILSKIRQRRARVKVNAVCGEWEVNILGTIKGRPDLRLFSCPLYYGKTHIFHNAETPEDCPEYTMKEVLDKGALNYEEEQEEAVRRVRENPFTYICAYCDYTNDELYYLQRHVNGIKATNPKTGKSFLRIDCGKRIVEDELDKKYKKRAIPLSCPEPKRYPWADITCKDISLVDKNGKFLVPVPDNIIDEYCKVFKL